MNCFDLIGVPYKENGRSKEEGFDCYGLAIEVERRLGKKLNDVVYNNHDIELSNKYAPTLNVKLTNSIEEGNLIEMHLKNTLHIGVILNDREFIHATEKYGVKISSIKAFPISNIYKVI